MILDDCFKSGFFRIIKVGDKWNERKAPPWSLVKEES